MSDQLRLEVGQAGHGPATSALFDPTMRYRYYLRRTWQAGRSHVLFVMLNPSVADRYFDDATIRKCMAFARRWNYGGIEVVNLFALRATDPRELRRAEDPVGPDNDRQILIAVRKSSGPIIFAWGANGNFKARDQAVLHLLRSYSEAQCLGFTKSHQPKHPLYLPLSTSAELFRPDQRDPAVVATQRRMAREPRELRRSNEVAG